MTITHSVTYVIAGDVSTVAVYDDAPVPFAWDGIAVIDMMGGMAYPADWMVLGEDKR